MIEKIIKDICEDLAEGEITEDGLKRLLQTSLQLYPKLLEVERKVIKDIADMKRAKGKNEYDNYNLASGAVHAENGLISIQDRLVAMESTIIALRGLLGKSLPFIMYVNGKPVLKYRLCESSKLLEIFVPKFKNP